MLGTGFLARPLTTEEDGILCLAGETVETGSASSVVTNVYYATASGIHVWSSDTRDVKTFSSFPSYEIEISPAGFNLFVLPPGTDPNSFSGESNRTFYASITY